MQKARNPRTEVADFIIDDLKEAAKLLPVDKAISSSDEGRLSCEAALAFLSRVALYEVHGRNSIMAVKIPNVQKICSIPQHRRS